MWYDPIKRFLETSLFTNEYLQYSNDQMVNRHGGFQGNIPGLAFHQPFQHGYSGFHNGATHQPITQETPISPRTVQATTHTPQDPPVFRQQVDDAYSGAFPPAIVPHLHQFQQTQNLVPHLAMMDNSHHRESVISMLPYDPTNCYGQYGNGYTAQAGYHMQPNHHHGGP
jgi:hypothetical protein